MSEQPQAQPEAKPEAKEEEVEGREVFVTRDEQGVTSMSEDAEGADPTVVATDEGAPHGDDAADRNDENSDSTASDDKD
jgi:hypothetical protein